MNTNVGKISLDMVLNSREFDRKLTSKMNAIQKSTTKDLGKIESTVTGPLSSAFSKLGVVIAAAFSAKAIVNFSSDCLKLASDLQEVQNVVQTAFPAMEQAVNEFASTSIERVGMSEKTYKEYIGTMGLMAQSFNFTEKQALSMSKSLTDLVGDVSSIRNISFQESYDKLKAVFTGETESLKQIGVVMTQNALDQYALEKGLGKTTAKMTEQEKVALRFSFVLDKLAYAQGDFIKTSSSWANSTRQLSESFNQLKIVVGTQLLKALAPVVEMLNSLIKKTTIFLQTFFKIKGLLGEDVSDSMSSVSVTSEEVQDNIEGIGDAAVETSKKIQKSLMGFDEINKLNGPLDNTSNGSSVSDSDLINSLIGDMSNLLDDGSDDLDEFRAKCEEFLRNLLKQWDETTTPIINRFNELKTNFENGFKLSIDSTNAVENLEKVRTNAGRIKEGLESIFDDEVQSSISNFANASSTTFGQITGVAAGVGIALSAGISEGTADFIENKGPQIHQHLIDIFDIGTEVTENVGNIAENVGKIVSDVFSSDEFASNVQHIEGLFETVFSNSTILAEKFTRDVTGEINDFLVENGDNIAQEQKELLDFTGSILGDFESTADSVGNTLQKTYDDKIGPFIHHIGDGMSDAAKKWHDSWEQNVTPALDTAKGKFHDFTENTLKPMLDDVLGPNGSFGKFVDSLSDFYDNLLKPLIDFCVQNIPAGIDDVITAIENFMEKTLKSLTEKIDGILTTLTGIIEFITGVFTGDWDKAWQGIKDTVDGVVKYIEGLIDGLLGKMDLIGGAAKGAIEAISGQGTMEYAEPEGKGLSKYVIANENADKGALFRNYDWVGAIGDLFTKGEYTKKNREKSSGKIPALASGGFVEQPHLALISEKGPEIVSPVDKMAETFENVLNKVGGAGQAQTIVLNNYVPLDGKLIFQESKTMSFNEANRQGARQYR